MTEQATTGDPFNFNGLPARDYLEQRHALIDSFCKAKSDDQSLDSFIEDIEKKMLEDALRKARYNKTRAAEQLGISFRSFRYKLKKFGID